MFTPRTAYRISCAAAAVILALAVNALTTAPMAVCGDLASGYSPVTAFELVRSVQDLQAIFGESADVCRSALVARMDAVNVVDLWLIIPAYGALLIGFFLGIRERNPRLAAWASWIVLVACATDYIENFCLFQLSANPMSLAVVTVLIGPRN